VVAVSPACERHPELVWVADLLRDDVSQDLPGSDMSRRALVDLMSCMCCAAGRNSPPAAAFPRITDPGIAAALGAIPNAPHQQWTVQRLSRRPTPATSSTNRPAGCLRTDAGTRPRSAVTRGQAGHALLAHLRMLAPDHTILPELT